MRRLQDLLSQSGLVKVRLFKVTTLIAFHATHTKTIRSDCEKYNVCIPLGNFSLRSLREPALKTDS